MADLSLTITELKQLVEHCMVDTICVIRKKECIGKNYQKDLSNLEKLYSYFCLFDCFQTQEEIDDAVCGLQTCSCSTVSPRLKLALGIDKELSNI